MRRDARYEVYLLSTELDETLCKGTSDEEGDDEQRAMKELARTRQLKYDKGLFANAP